MSEIPRGAIRFNTDSNKPELWDGSQWAELQLSTPNLGQGSDTQPGARGLIGGGDPASPVAKRTVDYLNIASTGDSLDYGDLVSDKANITACSSSTRCVTFGGGSPGSSNEMDFATISSTGNFADFGDILTVRRGAGACSNSTRGIVGGGLGGPSDARQTNMEYITIS